MRAQFKTSKVEVLSYPFPFFRASFTASYHGGTLYRQLHCITLVHCTGLPLLLLLTCPVALYRNRVVFVPCHPIHLQFHLNISPGTCSHDCTETMACPRGGRDQHTSLRARLT